VARGHDSRNEALNRTVKQMEWWQLLRSAFPLIAIGIGIGGLYLYLGSISARFWVGSGLAFTGAVLASIGYVGRLREIRQPGDPTTRHYPLLFLAWALVLAGVFIPPFSAR
jgi:drug/metabolite transporter (DMT)-like permease